VVEKSRGSLTETSSQAPGLVSADGVSVFRGGGQYGIRGHGNLGVVYKVATCAVRGMDCIHFLRSLPLEKSF
jgi:hypothetical protein